LGFKSQVSHNRYGIAFVDHGVFQQEVVLFDDEAKRDAAYQEILDSGVYLMERGIAEREIRPVSIANFFVEDGHKCE
jgi:hypothetical protein